MLTEQDSGSVFAGLSSAAALDLNLVDPLLRGVVKTTNRSPWLRTEFSCSGMPDDHAIDSDGTVRRWGSHTAGEMYIANACPWVEMNRVLETAIGQASTCGLPLTIRFNSWSGDVQDISMTAPVAHFAVAVHYEPADLASTQAALSVFGQIAAMAG
jgi:hypothetical protein